MRKLLADLRAKRENGDDGFTLIELLVVILILGILAAIVVVALSGTSEDAHTKACAEDVANTYNAVENYVLKNSGTSSALPPPALGVDNLITTIQGSANNYNSATMHAMIYRSAFPTNAENNLGQKYGELSPLVPDYISKIPDDVAVYYIQEGTKVLYAVGPNFNIRGATGISTITAQSLPISPLSTTSLAGCTVAGL